MKINKLLTVKISESMDASITSLLETLSRKLYPTKSDLVRELLNIGLTKMWKEVLKNEKE